MATDEATLAPWAVRCHDILRTPLGVDAVVLGVSKKQLWLRYPGDVKAPLPADAKTRDDLVRFGYTRRGEAAHIQRTLDERENLLFEQRYFGGPGPKTADIVLPEPKGAEYAPHATLARPATATNGRAKS